MDEHRLGVPKAFIRREIQIVESSIAEVEGEAAPKTTLSGPWA
jgi:hypothetical protein